MGTKVPDSPPPLLGPNTPRAPNLAYASLILTHLGSNSNCPTPLGGDTGNVQSDKRK